MVMDRVVVRYFWESYCFYTDMRNGVRVLIGNFFGEVSLEHKQNSARVDRDNAAAQHGNKKAVFHDDFVNVIVIKCEDSFDCNQLIFA